MNPLGTFGAGRRLFAAAAFGSALLAAAPSTAAASTAITRIDVTGTTFTNPCTAEAITIHEGTLQLIVTTTSDDAGGLHIGLRGNAQGVVARGETSGEMYRLAGDFWSQQTIRDAGYPLTLTVVEVHNAVSAGSAPNLIVHIVQHLTITAAGDITSTVADIRAECRG